MTAPDDEKTSDTPVSSGLPSYMSGAPANDTVSGHNEAEAVTPETVSQTEQSATASSSVFSLGQAAMAAEEAPETPEPTSIPNTEVTQTTAPEAPAPQATDATVFSVAPDGTATSSPSSSETATSTAAPEAVSETATPTSTPTVNAQSKQQSAQTTPPPAASQATASKAAASGVAMPKNTAFSATHPILSVEQSMPPSAGSRLFSALALLPFLTISVLVVLQTLFTLDARPLWFGDEARYADIFANLMQHGKGIILELNGEAYPAKPPLFFWMLKGLQMLTQLDGPLLFFVTSALCALLFCWAALGLGRCVARADRRTNLAAGLILVSSMMFFCAGHIAGMDLLFAAIVLLSHIILYRAYVSQKQAIFSMAAAFLLAGVATLINGPAGFALPLGTLILFAMWRGTQDQTRCILITVAALICGLLPVLAGLPIAQAAGYLLEESTLPLTWGLCGLAVPAILLIALAALNKQLRIAAALALVLMCGAFVLSGGTPYFSWPLIYVLPICVFAALAAWQITPQRLFRMDFFIGLVIGLAVSLLWFALIFWQTGTPDFIVEDLLQRQLLDTVVHGITDARPWHYYLIVLPALLLPWAIILILLPWQNIFSKNARASLADSRRPVKEGLAYLVCMAAVSLLFFFLLGDKQMFHLLPALAAVAILAARAALSFSGKRAFTFRLAMAATLVVMGAIALAASLMMFGVLPTPAFLGVTWAIPMHGSFFAVAAVLFAGGMLVWLAVGSSRPEGVLLVTALTITILAVPVWGLALPRMNSLLSPKEQALTLKAYTEKGYNAFSYQTPKGAYSYYSGGPVSEIQTPEALAAMAGKERSIIALPQAEAEAFTSTSACHKTVQSQWLGNTEYALLACPPMNDIAVVETAPSEDTIITDIIKMLSVSRLIPAEPTPNAAATVPQQSETSEPQQAPVSGQEQVQEPLAPQIDQGPAEQEPDAMPGGAADVPADVPMDVPVDVPADVPVDMPMTQDSSKPNAHAAPEAINAPNASDNTNISDAPSPSGTADTSDAPSAPSESSPEGNQPSLPTQDTAHPAEDKPVKPGSSESAPEASGALSGSSSEPAPEAPSAQEQPDAQQQEQQEHNQEEAPSPAGQTI